MNHIVSSHRDHRLKHLSENSISSQWNVDTDIDWSMNIKRPSWLLGRFHGALISQFKFGELATIKVCQSLLKNISDPSIRSLLKQQIADEERHAHVYDRYLHRIGDDAPYDQAMSESVNRILQWQGSHLGIITAVHIVLEGEALRTLQDLADDIPCPLFSQINTRISRDEARHVAFGKVYLRAHLSTLSLDERIAVFRFVRNIWTDCTSNILSDFKIPGFVSNRLRKRWVDAGWTRHCRSMVDIGLLNEEQMSRV